MDTARAQQSLQHVSACRGIPPAWAFCRLGEAPLWGLAVVCLPGLRMPVVVPNCGEDSCFSLLPFKGTFWSVPDSLESLSFFHRKKRKKKLYSASELWIPNYIPFLTHIFAPRTSSPGSCPQQRQVLKKTTVQYVDSFSIAFPTHQDPADLSSSPALPQTPRLGEVCSAP